MLVIPMDNTSAARGRFLYIMFMFFPFMMFSPSPPNPYRLLALEALAAQDKHSLEVMQDTTYEGAFEIPQALNLTGVYIPRCSHVLIEKANFTVPDYVRRSVDALSPRYGEDEEMAYYNNITGIVRGKWY